MNTIFEFGKAICYSGYREGQRPGETVPSVEQIEEDIMILNKDGYKYLRMYDPNLHARRVLETIKKYNLDMKCLIGIDSKTEINNPNCSFEDVNFSDEVLKENAKRNDAEIDKLIELVKEFPELIIAVSIGNENTPDWGAHIVSEERLIEHADKLKRETGKPVTFCEGFYEWKKLEKLASHLDFISVHNYPLHNNVPLKDALNTNKSSYKEMKELFPDKQVIFTEMGWTSQPAVHMDPTQANPEFQKIYVTDLQNWIEEEKVIVFIFEAFDEPWKGSRPESSECNWGLYYVNRTKKW